MLRALARWPRGRVRGCAPRPDRRPSARASRHRCTSALPRSASGDDHVGGRHGLHHAAARCFERIFALMCGSPSLSLCSCFTSSFVMRSFWRATTSDMARRRPRPETQSVDRHAAGQRDQMHRVRERERHGLRQRSSTSALCVHINMPPCRRPRSTTTCRAADRALRRKGAPEAGNRVEAVEVGRERLRRDEPAAEPRQCGREHGQDREHAFLARVAGADHHLMRVEHHAVIEGERRAQNRLQMRAERTQHAPDTEKSRRQQRERRQLPRTCNLPFLPRLFEAPGSG